MKRTVLFLFLMASILCVKAQEQGKIRGGMNFGLGLPQAGFGLNADFDIRYNIKDNVNVGVLLNGAFGLKNLTANATSSLVTATAFTTNATLLTSDYYFNKGLSNFAPFLGGGVGLYGVTNLYMTGNGSVNYSSNNSPQPKEDLIPGGLLRGGFEASRFRLTLMWFLIPNTNLYNEKLVKIGTSENSYINLSLGFYIGGGKWKKN